MFCAIQLGISGLQAAVTSSTDSVDLGEQNTVTIPKDQATFVLLHPDRNAVHYQGKEYYSDSAKGLSLLEEAIKKSPASAVEYQEYRKAQNTVLLSGLATIGGVVLIATQLKSETIQVQKTDENGVPQYEVVNNSFQPVMEDQKKVSLKPLGFFGAIIAGLGGWATYHHFKKSRLAFRAARHSYFVTQPKFSWDPVTKTYKASARVEF